MVISDPAPDTGTVRLDYRTPTGSVETVVAGGGPWVPEQPGVMRRKLFTGDGQTLMVQRAAEPGDRTGGATGQLRLENEIRASVRLMRRFGDAAPAGLPSLVGYNLDAATPYLLCRMPDVRPVTELAADLLLNQRRQFQIGLFRTLGLLAAAGVVHAGIRPETVGWDGWQVSLTGYGFATPAGEPYRLDVSSPWMPPHAVRNAAAAPGDDIWAAGLVVAHVVTGRPVEHLAEALNAPGGGALASLLDGAFAPDPDRRPTAVQLLRRLGDHTPIEPDSVREDAALAAGRAAFDAERAKKLGDTETAPAAVPEPVPVERAGLPLRGIASVLGALLIVIAVVTLWKALS
jgi:hypothetical protein